MYLHEIQAGSKVFIDANIFVYHFSEGSEFNKSCTDFLVRVETSEIHGITSVGIMQEAIHRLMVVESSGMLGVGIRELPKYLKQHPEFVKQLTQHLVVPRKISELNIEMLPITSQLVEKSQDMKTRYGFLSNDALSLQIMEEASITMLASNDADFMRVEWVKLFLPLSEAEQLQI